MGAMANPHAKVLTPQHPQVPSLGHNPSKRMKIMFNLFVRTHTKFCIKIFEIDIKKFNDI